MLRPNQSGLVTQMTFLIKSENEILKAQTKLLEEQMCAQLNTEDSSTIFVLVKF